MATQETEEITFSDFEKLDLRIGKILEVNTVQNQKN